MKKNIFFCGLNFQLIGYLVSEAGVRCRHFVKRFAGNQFKFSTFGTTEINNNMESARSEWKARLSGR
jgi:hypothetical protein